MTAQRTKGLINAIISGCTFGMIPLFSKPALSAGMGTTSIVVYRFFIASIVIFAVMKLSGCNLSITKRQFFSITILALLNIISAYTLIYGYNFLDSGAATTIQFSYPVFTCILMIIAFKERPSHLTIIAIVLAVIGVTALSGVITDSHDSHISVQGVALELFSGFTYAVYLVLVPKLKLDELECAKITFWVFATSTVLGFIVVLPIGGLEPVSNVKIGWSLVLLGLIPTAISNLTLVVSLRAIGSTVTSILGALEPFTAILVGIFLFNEPFTAMIAIGFILIITSTTILIKQK